MCQNHFFCITFMLYRHNDTCSNLEWVWRWSWMNICWDVCLSWLWDAYQGSLGCRRFGIQVVCPFLIDLVEQWQWWLGLSESTRYCAPAGSSCCKVESGQTPHIAVFRSRQSCFWSSWRNLTQNHNLVQKIFSSFEFRAESFDSSFTLQIW